jgi:hypothetical protein
MRKLKRIMHFKKRIMEQKNKIGTFDDWRKKVLVVIYHCVYVFLEQKKKI